MHKLAARTTNAHFLIAILAVVFICGPNQPSAAQEQNDTPEAPETVALLTILPTGFEPSSLTVPPGRFLLIVNNQTGLDGITLRLESQTEADPVPILLQKSGNEPELMEPQVTITKEHLEWDSILDLPAGNYVLTETEHPKWYCSIAVTNVE
jgi:hypothetical protein